MMRRRRIFLHAGAVAVLGALVGCGGGDSDSAPTTAAPTTAAPTTVATTVAPTTAAPATAAPTTTAAAPAEVIAADGWTQAADGTPWGGRAGLRVVALDGDAGQQLLVIAGRTPKQSSIPGASDLWGDVWRSDNAGLSWTKVLEDGPAFSPRAYFQALVHDGAVYVIGGQDFKFPQSSFFNDVWRSTDGVTWEQTTAEAPWVGRAGGAVAVHEGALYLLGGEVGFICQPYPGCDPPYFNDVWKTTDGAKWELVTDNAEWSPRPGHQCESIGVAGTPQIVCFGGFGQGSNPIDVWTSADGATWTLTDSKPWNATVSEQGRYDFDSTVVMVPHTSGMVPAIITVGGDRETFDFGDPDNWLRVDDDVWWFVVPGAAQ